MKNKKLLLFLSIFLFAVLILYIYLPCQLSSLFEGKTGYNKDISQSKNTGVFLTEYKIVDNRIIFPNRNSIPVGEIWAEHAWTQGDCSKRAAVTKHNEYSNYWIYIEILNAETEENVNEFKRVLGKEIAILTAEGNSFSIRKIGEKNYLFVSFKNLPSKTEKLSIIERNDSSKSEIIPQKWNNPKIVGIINLVAK